MVEGNWKFRGAEAGGFFYGRRARSWMEGCAISVV